MIGIDESAQPPSDRDQSVAVKEAVQVWPPAIECEPVLMEAAIEPAFRVVAFIQSFVAGVLTSAAMTFLAGFLICAPLSALLGPSLEQFMFAGYGPYDFAIVGVNALAMIYVSKLRKDPDLSIWGFGLAMGLTIMSAEYVLHASASAAFW